MAVTQGAAREQELIIRFKPSAPSSIRTQLVQKHGTATPLKRQVARQGTAGGSEIVVLKTTSPEQVESALAEFSRNIHVEYIEPNYPVKLAQAPRIPNDFEFENMYALSNPGRNGKEGADVKAPQAWAITTGSRSVRVAVIDTGIDYFHEDLRENIWVNAREIAGNGLDDDGNGWVDDRHGYDFMNNDHDPMDDHMHGTHVAGTIGAQGNNQIGVAGVCWEVSLMALKAFDADGNGTVSEAVQAIDYAIANGAKIINASWGLPERSRALEDALAAAEQAGVLVVAAAGNERTDLPAYPAAIESVLAVAATDSNDLRAQFTNHGPWVDLAAPGVEILSTVLAGEYGTSSGTSMAAPHVAGAAALMLSVKPTLSPREMRRMLVNTSDYLQMDRLIGHGRLNAAAAVNIQGELPEAELEVEARLQRLAPIRGTATGEGMAGYSVWGGRGNYPTNWTLLFEGHTPVNQGEFGTFDTALLDEGPATLRLVVTNAAGVAAYDYARVRIQNVQIVNPLSGDILKHGPNYEIRGTVFGRSRRYKLEFGEGYDPMGWTVLSSGQGTGEPGQVLGRWDTQALASDQYYSLRIVVESSSDTNFVTASMIYLDSTGVPGWPVRWQTATAPGNEWRNLRPVDLDGDGNIEVVTVDASADARGGVLKVYTKDGALLWERALPAGDPAADLPAIGDFDGVPGEEIVVDAGGKILVFDRFGAEWSGAFPLPILHKNAAKSLSDLDGDGRLELVALVDPVLTDSQDDPRELRIYANSGELLRFWSTIACGYTNQVQEPTPAIGDLGNDGVPEIVVPWGCNEVAAFSLSHSNQPLWRATLPAKVLAAPVIGDLDGDGTNEVVVVSSGSRGNGGVFVFNGAGELWPGWPVLENESFMTQPVLADCDGDGKLEIALANAVTPKLHLVQHDGFEAEGWPVEITRAAARAGISFADVTGDGLPELLANFPGPLSLAQVTGDRNYVPGMRVFTFDGKQIRLPGIGVLPVEGWYSGIWSKMAPPVVTDLDGDGVMDILQASFRERTFGVASVFKNRSSVYARELAFRYAPQTNSWTMAAGKLDNTGFIGQIPAVNPGVTNDFTTAVKDRLISREDNAVIISPLRNDFTPNGGSLTLISNTTPTNGAALAVGNQIRYEPKADFNGVDSFAYVVKGGDGLQSTGSIKILVKPVNDAPRVADQTVRLNRNTSYMVGYDGVDPEGDGITYRIVTEPKHADIYSYPTVGQYVPHTNYFGTDFFTVVASDGLLESAPGRISVEITNTNNPPKAQSQSLTVRTNQFLFLTLKAADPDREPLQFLIVTEPANGGLQRSGAGYLYTPRPDFRGTDRFTFKATDGELFSEVAEVQIRVTAENTAPIASPTTVSAVRNQSTEVTVSGFDPEGTTVTYQLQYPPLRGHLIGDLPRVTYIPPQNFVGRDRFSFTVNDGAFSSTPATVEIKVGSGNSSPILTVASYRGLTNTQLSVQLQVHDAENDSLQIVILKGTRSGRLFGMGTNLVYQPSPGFVGFDSFTCKVWDGFSYSKEARMELLIAPPEAEPKVIFSDLQIRAVESKVRLLLKAPSRRTIRVERSSDFARWEVVGRFAPPENTIEVEDGWVEEGAVFYRAIIE